VEGGILVDVLEVWIPLQPDPGLSPNARLHWSEKRTLVAVARLSAKLATFDVLSQLPAAFPLEYPLHLEWTVHWGKGRKMMDTDNCLASLKPYQDGVADALGVNDQVFSSSVVQLRAEGASGVALRVVRSSEPPEEGP
jgi:crossover junction endodeoxyribonuclease RusA